MENTKSTKKMSDTTRAIRFFYLYLKKYKLQFAVIMIFIIAATWLQVIAPSLLGDAITNLSKYVGDFFTHQHADDARKALEQMAQALSQQTHQNITWQHVPEFAKSLPQAAQEQLTSQLPKGTTLQSLYTVATSHAASTGTFMKGMWQLLAVYIATGVSMLIYTLLFSRIVAHSTNRMRKGLFGNLNV